MAAVLVPMAFGVKVTAIAHVDPAAKLPPQELLEITKSLLFVPLTLMLLIVNETVPTLVKFTFWGALLAPKTWSG
jgi:hypothetical protein